MHLMSGFDQLLNQVYSSTLWLNRGDNISLSVDPDAAAVFNNISSFYANIFPQTRSIVVAIEEPMGSIQKVVENELNIRNPSLELGSPVLVSLDWVHRTESQVIPLLSCYSSHCTLPLFSINDTSEGTYELLMSRKMYLPSEDKVQACSVVIARVAIHTSGKIILALTMIFQIY